MADFRSLEAFEKWKRARDKAAAAEMAYFDGVLRSLGGAVRPPPESDLEHAIELRREAQALFREAMQQVHRLNQDAAALIQRARPRVAPQDGAD